MSAKAFPWLQPSASRDPTPLQLCVAGARSAARMTMRQAASPTSGLLVLVCNSKQREHYLRVNHHDILQRTLTSTPSHAREFLYYNAQFYICTETVTSLCAAPRVPPRKQTLSWTSSQAIR
jgi:hypothetical protein